MPNAINETKQQQRGPLFTEGMKMADLVDANYMLLPVLERLGIPLGFGELSVEEACREAGVEPKFFILLSNIHTVDGYMPDEKQLAEINPVVLIDYLYRSHKYYSSNLIPRLKERLGHLVSSCRTMHGELLNRFFDNYESEINKHFRYEDEVVFPYVRGVVEGRREPGYSIERFEENHDNIDEKLADLKNIIMKYLPRGCDEVRRSEVLFELFRLREDLDKHTMMENLILIPMVAGLEMNIR